jgi:hypothetical protein
MKLFESFRTAKAVDFAKTVVTQYCQVAVLVDSSKKHAGRRPKRMIEIIRSVSTFARAEKLNFYVRAKMLTEIRYGLKAAGIDATDIDAFIRDIAVEELHPSG